MEGAKQNLLKGGGVGRAEVVPETSRPRLAWGSWANFQGYPMQAEKASILPCREDAELAPGETLAEPGPASCPPRPAEAWLQAKRRLLGSDL